MISYTEESQGYIVCLQWQSVMFINIYYSESPTRLLNYIII